jgi:hypothetical protein
MMRQAITNLLVPPDVAAMLESRDSEHPRAPARLEHSTGSQVRLFRDLADRLPFTLLFAEGGAAAFSGP